MKHIQRSALDQVRVACPSPALLNSFDSQARFLLRFAIDLRRQVDVLSSARDALLPKLVTGKIDVDSLGVDDVFELAAAAGESRLQSLN